MHKCESGYSVFSHRGCVIGTCKAICKLDIPEQNSLVCCQQLRTIFHTPL